MMEMTAPLHPVYTNEVTPDYLRTLDQLPFTEQQLAGFSEEALIRVRQRQAYCKAHPPTGICRFATAGSQTRDGGVIQQATTRLTITLNDEQKASVAQVGDCVVYSDGRTAQIVTGAGKDNSHFALVGSLLCNGDRIINTPQSVAYCVLRDGIAKAEDFLPEGISHA
jgi:hypothetical protein